MITMAGQATKNPRIKQGWLRLLLFGICFCVITLLVAIPVVLMAADIHPEDLEHDPIQVLSGLLTGNYLWLMLVLELAISVITVVIFRLFVDRKSLLSLGWQGEGFGAEALTGLLMGPALLGITALLVFLSGHLEWTDIVWDGNQLFISFGLMVLIAFSEELVFRGYILGNLLDSFAQQNQRQTTATQKWIALAISAVLFACFHITNPGLHTLAFVNLVLAGMLLGINYIYTRNLWFSVLFHISWNFFQGPVLGFRVSGLNLPSVFLAEPKGDLFITGGDFGLEGSMLNTLVSVTALLVLAWAFERKYRPGSPGLSPSPSPAPTKSVA
ncbi:MAG TPA: CPBP family intramembrane glutamic endopeptidase [Puia sp.]|nr:CPBP family intramembrane glutamic endopeptidase [Puia sp.]